MEAFFSGLEFPIEDIFLVNRKNITGSKQRARSARHCFRPALRLGRTGGAHKARNIECLGNMQFPWLSVFPEAAIVIDTVGKV